jgi:hypothetical protein
MQENLMAESPQEEEVSGRGSNVEEDISVITLSRGTDEVRTEQEMAHKEAGTSEAWSSDNKEKASEIMNSAAEQETDTNKDSNSDPKPASVVNIGFDL